MRVLRAGHGKGYITEKGRKMLEGKHSDRMDDLIIDCHDNPMYAADLIVSLSGQVDELRAWIRKAIDDSEIGVVPRNHLDRGSALLGARDSEEVSF